MNKQLVTFHQIAPLPYRQLAPYVQDDPEFHRFLAHSPTTIATYFKCSVKQAKQYQAAYAELSERDIVAEYAAQQIHVICYGDARYPASLYTIYDPPAVLYVKGNVDALTQRAIAIIGSRKATDYSRYAIEQLMPACKRANVAIVSGLARGADTMAHEAAIRHGCATIAVLGHGFMHMYPREHTKLAAYIAASHTLVTEYPYTVGPKKWHFPMRNRIISGLSEAVVVTEAEMKSGTMSTIDYALAHGKDIYAVPGNIFSPLSTGPNALIAEGATALTLDEMASFLQHF